MKTGTAFDQILTRGRGVFNRPTFDNFGTLVIGFVLAGNPGLPSRALRALGPLAPKHFSTYYRFFQTACWSLDDLGGWLIGLLEPFLPEGAVTVLVDDTLTKKTGRHIWGANIHHDPLGFLPRSVAFGHAWVVLALVVHLPGMERPVAVPVLFRLYRSTKTRTGKNRRGQTERKTRGAARKREHKTRPQLAHQMLQVLRKALPEREIHLVGDSTYQGKTLASALPAGVTLVSRMPMKARLYGLPPTEKSRRGGRPRTKGAQLPSPRQMAKDRQGWKKRTVRLYGRKVTVRYKTVEALWYQAAGQRLVRVVLVRDPQGRRDDECFYATDAAMTPEQILETYALRWNLEVAIRDGKQLFGFERPQSREKQAVERTAPFTFVVYALTLVWWGEYGHAHAALPAPARWYERKKKHASIADILQALRTELLREYVLEIPLAHRDRQNLHKCLEHLMLCVA